jgi:hypothetical protein
MQQDCNIIFWGQKPARLTMISFRAGNISSALCTTTFGTFVATACRVFCELET